MSGALPATTVVVPTLARPSLAVLLEALAAQDLPLDVPVVLVDDRPGLHAHPAVEDAVPPALRAQVRVLRSGGRGPAAARNLGWRHARTAWVSFLDDDVVPPADWYRRLRADLANAGTALGSQARVRVPLPTDRRPTDWERSTAGLADALWITADLSYRRDALVRAGGFDERFPRAFREDADLALRLGAHVHPDGGWDGVIARGAREIVHPVRPSNSWASLRQQAGNADDALMARLHGPRWHARAGAPRGALRRHVAVTAAGLGGLLAAAAHRPRAASLLGAAWAAGTAVFAAERIAPGPRTREEVRRMLLTSVAIPPAAVVHRLRGEWRHRRTTAWRGLPDLVLFDRDGTLVHDVPYNGDPERVAVVDGVPQAIGRLRERGIRVGVVTNQSAVGRGLITEDQVHAVHQRIEAEVGALDSWSFCPHTEQEGCACRKPAPGLVLDALAAHGVPGTRCVVVGDIGSDLDAAAAAGAQGVLVPTPRTRRAEVAAARRRAPSVAAAVEEILEGRW